MRNLLLLMITGFLGFLSWKQLSLSERQTLLEFLEENIPSEYIAFLRKEDCSDTSHVSLCLLKQYDIKFDTIVMCQHILETGWNGKKSDIYLNGNNAFGMKESRRTNHSGVYKGHAAYPSLLWSIKDYKEWQLLRLYDYETRTGAKVRTEEEYLIFLEKLFPKGKGFASYAEWKDVNNNHIWDYKEKILSIRKKLYNR